MLKSKLLIMGLAVLVIAGVIFVKRIAAEKPRSHEDIIAEFTRLYFASAVHNRTKWLGVPSLQNPCDMWILQEIISETKPDFIVETGTFKGGGALFLATVLRQVNEKGRIITVDIEPRIEEASRYAIFNEAVEVLTGSSVSEDIVKAIADKVKGARVMVTLDSNHAESHVLRELEIYSQFVSVNSYLVVQDTAHNGHPLPTNYEGGGPMEAVREFLKSHKNFAADRSREKFLLTFFPLGYLKRLS